MSKIINALKDLEEQRCQQPDSYPPGQQNFFEELSGPPQVEQPAEKEYFVPISKPKGDRMKNQWWLWGLIVVVIGVVLFAFNYQGSREAVPLSEIFPDRQGPDSTDVEYVFMDTPVVPAEETAPVTGPESPVAIIPQIAPAVPIKEAPAPNVTAAAQAIGQAAYTIQVASFRQKDQAQKMVAELKDSGHTAFLAEKDLAEKGIWFRVYVGTFSSKEAADSYLIKVKSKYSGSFVLHL